MVESPIGGNLVEGAAGAGLGIERPVDQSAESGVDERAGTHRAGFERHRHRAVVESPGAESLAREPQGDEFGVAGRIAGRFAVVRGLGDDLVAAIDDRTDRNLVVARGSASQFDRPIHHPQVERVDAGMAMLGETKTRHPAGPPTTKPVRGVAGSPRIHRCASRSRATASHGHDASGSDFSSEGGPSTSLSGSESGVVDGSGRSVWSVGIGCVDASPSRPA